MEQGNKVRLIGGPIVAHNWAPKGIEGIVLSLEPEETSQINSSETIDLWRVDFKVNGEHEDWWVQESEVEMVEVAI